MGVTADQIQKPLLINQTPAEFRERLDGKHWALEVSYPLDASDEERRIRIGSAKLKYYLDFIDKTKRGKRLSGTLYRTLEEVVDGEVRMIYFARLL